MQGNYKFGAAAALGIPWGALGLCGRELKAIETIQRHQSDTLRQILNAVRER